jgi:hypothetical protein
MNPIYTTNLCKEVLISSYTANHITLNIRIDRKPMKQKYDFSREWFKANFDYKDYDEVSAWCTEMFGRHPKHPDAWSRWVHTYEDQIFFRDQQDYILFVLRWS